MLFGSYNNMNMIGMNKMFNMNGMFGCNNNMLGSLFSGTNSIFSNNCFNMFGMNNMFGGGCSPFTNCNGTINFNAMAGFGVANVLLGIGGVILSQHINNKKATSNEAIADDIDGIQEKIDANLKEIGSGVTEKDIKNGYDVKTEDWYTEGLAEINENKLNENELQENKNLIADYKEKAKLYKETEPTDPNYEQVKNNYEKALALKKEAEEKIAAHEKAVKDLEALNAKAKKEQAAVDDIIDEIKDLIEKRDNAEATLEDKLLSKGIGKEKKLISDDDYNNALNSHNDEDTANDVKFTKAHLQKAAAKYRKATTPEDKAKFKAEFNKIYEWLLDKNSGEISDDLATIAEMIL